MEKVTSKPKRVACEFEAFSPHLLLAWNATLMEIDAIIFDLRRRKDPDELRMLTRANEANRAIQAGETMILDLGVGFRGYHSDNCRTLAVDGNPSEKQQQAWKAAASVFDIIRSQARPGASCRAIFDEAQKQLDKSMPWVFDHHLGHGVGLAPQEGPHLNPCWKDTLAEGDFIAVEPGLYHEELHTGVRLEQNFLVTAAGARLMTDWPLEL
jgi:Xaa-Pro aminopeptidase